MALVPGPLPEMYKNARRRVVVKMKDAALKKSALAAADAGDPAAAGGVWEALEQRFPGARVGAYFRETLAPPGALKAAKPTTETMPDAPRYLAIDVPEGAEAQAIAELVNAAPEVEIAYAEAGPTPPPVVDPSNDPRSPDQGYLDAAPDGIGARWAWSAARVDGSGIGFVDLEQGWTFAHEDLPEIELISGFSAAYHGHGTAVLGEVCAKDNDIGCVGIAPRTRARVVSQWREGNVYGTAEAILSAVSTMEPGDVLLLEAQTTYVPTGQQNLPVEVEEAVFDAIRGATDSGIVVIEAAGNGSADLDAFEDANGRRRLDRTSPDFRDSGAIMVGAASSAAPHERLDFSNFGNRINCFAWGEKVETCGDGGLGSETAGYTSTFGGTSSASPIVTGAALLLQHWRERVGQERFDPSALRDLLADPARNTSSAEPADDRIGVMPDLRALLESENAKLDQPAPLEVQA